MQGWADEPHAYMACQHLDAARRMCMMGQGDVPTQQSAKPQTLFGRFNSTAERFADHRLLRPNWTRTDGESLFRPRGQDWPQ